MVSPGGQRDHSLVGGMASALDKIDLDPRDQSRKKGELQASLDRAAKGERHNSQMSSSRRSSGSAHSSEFKLSRDAAPFRPGSSMISPSLPTANTTSTASFVDVPPSYIGMPSAKDDLQPYELKPRQGLEGYGFRPRSGASTPTTGMAPAHQIPRMAPTVNSSSTTQSAWQGIGFPHTSQRDPVASSSSAASSGRQPKRTLGSMHEQEVDYLDEMEDNAGDLLGKGTSGFDDVEDRGYGFGQPGQNPMTASEIADSEGLGWPAKLTHQRLHATPDQQAANLLRLSGAVRTVLECIGEDPDREGLEKTPERYAKALLWMTKGYEERLSGMYLELRC
jgi:GTP cyclohydrolase I